MKVIYFRYESHIHPFILLLFWETRKINFYVVIKSLNKKKTVSGVQQCMHEVKRVTLAGHCLE